MIAPHIIRTAEELEALDPDTTLILSASGRPIDAWATHSSDLPVAVIATGDQVRAVRKALEEKSENPAHEYAGYLRWLEEMRAVNHADDQQFPEGGHMTTEDTEKIELDEGDRDFVLDHLISNARRASGMGMYGMYKAWITAANAFGQATKKGSTE